MMSQILLLILGLVLVAKGGDLFVDSSVHLARGLGVPRIVIGATIVSLATTTPELVVSATASFMGDPGIAIGNAVGSAICNIGLIVGVVAIMTSVKVDLKDFRRRSVWMVAGAAAVIGASWDLEISRPVGTGLWVLSLGYLYYDFRHAREEKRARKQSGQVVAEEQAKIGKSILCFAAGIALVVAGSRLMVVSGVAIATALGIPSVIIGLSVIAVGTSLPELVTGITAARKGVPDLAIGNIVGANVLNLAMITGLSAAIRPLQLSRFTQTYSFSWLIVFIAAMIWMIGRQGEIRRRGGGVLVCLYLIYIAGLVFQPFASPS